MPPIRSSALECYALLVLLIFLLSEIIPTCSWCTKKQLLCITIVTPTSRQPLSCVKCTYINM